MGERHVGVAFGTKKVLQKTLFTFRQRPSLNLPKALGRFSSRLNEWLVALGKVVTPADQGPVSRINLCEPPGFARRLRLLSRMEHFEQDDEQVFFRNARAISSVLAHASHNP